MKLFESLRTYIYIKNKYSYNILMIYRTLPLYNLNWVDHIVA